MNLFVLRLVMNLVMCMEAAMRNIQHVFIALCDLGVLFLFLFFFLLLFSFYRESPEKLWILFSDTVLSTRVVNISPAQKNTKQTICFVVSQQIKKVLLFYFHVFCWFFYCSTFICPSDDLFHISLFSGKTRLFDSEQTIYLFYFKVKIIQKKLQKLIQKYMNSYKVILRTHFIYFLCSLSPQKTLESG